jgi:hypothetical protein
VGAPCQHDGVPDLPAPPDAGALEPRRAGELTASERALRRKNRRWMLFIIIPALILGVLALLATLALGSGQSSLHPATVPPGYREVNDSYFAYAIPASWAQNNAYTDDVGDLDSQGPSGWAAEHLGGRPSAPAPGEAPPSSFAVFGQTHPVPFQIGSATRITVTGAAVAYRYTVTRPQGFQAVAINAWQANSGAELWLLVHADPATTAAVIGSLRG